MLHITNGDTTVERIAVAGFGDTVLPWRDVLHEGPVPGGLTPAQLRVTRAQFLAGSGWALYEDVLTGLEERDAELEQMATHDEVVLWFEHDLYDQLQLLQILDRLASVTVRPASMSLICIDRFPGIERFFGLGQLTPEQITTLFPSRRPISDAQLRLGVTAWDVFTSPRPDALVALLEEDTRALPFLRAPIMRFLREYPSARDGLSRTERQILEALSSGPLDPVALFQATQQREEHPYHGDTTLWSYARALSVGDRPLIHVVGGSAFTVPSDAPEPAAFRDQRLSLTDDGRAALAGELDAVSLRGIDRWIGGVHLTGRDVAWRWDAEDGRLISA